MLTILQSLASACLALPMRRRLFSAKEREESSQIPNHLVASFAKRTVWLPTQIALLLCRCFRFLESRIASVLEVSNRTALSLAHLRLAAGYSVVCCDLVNTLRHRTCVINISAQLMDPGRCWAARNVV